MEENAKPNIITYIRTIALGVTLVNMILAAGGINPLPFTSDEAYTAMSSVAAAAASIWAWWKNNNFSAFALDMSKVAGLVKDGSITVEQIIALAKNA